jgi:hypothetical protein
LENKMEQYWEINYVTKSYTKPKQKQ